MAVTDTLAETVTPGVVSVSDTRLPAFLEGQQILTWDAALHKKTFAKLFGSGVEIEMMDISAEIAREIPQVAGKSLLRLRELSSMARYCDGESGELDVFVNLFRSFVRRREKTDAEEGRDLQLAALGTIGDIMPLTDENRIIVKGGLRSLIPENTEGGQPGGGARAGIAELLEKLGFVPGQFSVTDVSWKLCPVLNAARRMGMPEKAAALFFEKEPAARHALARELVALNGERKQREEAILAMVEGPAFKSLAEHCGRLVAVYGESLADTMNKGVIGLVAQRLSRRHNVPAVVVCPMEDGSYKGSVRSVRGYRIGGLLEGLSDPLIDFGGHDFAGGFSFAADRRGEFGERLKTAAAAIEFSEGAEASVSVDAELPLDYLTPDRIFRLVDVFAPYGQGNRELNFLAKSMVVEELDFVGKKDSRHLRLTLSGGRYKWPALYWDAAERVVNKEFGKGDTVDVVFSVSRDRYKGRVTPRMTISDLRRSG